MLLVAMMHRRGGAGSRTGVGSIPGRRLRIMWIGAAAHGGICLRVSAGAGTVRAHGVAVAFRHLCFVALLVMLRAHTRTWARARGSFVSAAAGRCSWTG